MVGKAKVPPDRSLSKHPEKKKAKFLTFGLSVVKGPVA